MKHIKDIEGQYIMCNCCDKYAVIQVSDRHFCMDHANELMDELVKYVHEGVRG